MSASKNKITPKDILASAKYHEGDILDFKANEFRDNKTKNKKAIYDVSWIPIYFKFVDTLSNGNKQTKLLPIKKIEFSKVITSSGLKLPQIKKGDNLKCMLLTFKKLTWDDVYGGDYVEKPKKTLDEQNAEKSALKTRINNLLENTNEFVEALDCIANGHKLLCEKLKQQASTLKFKIKKDKTSEGISIRSIRQTHRERKDEDGEANDDEDDDVILLPTPLYRIKVPVHDGQLVLSWFKKGTKDIETKDIIFDSRKTLIDDSGRVEYKPAKVKVNNKWQSLNTSNAGAFFTYKSEIAGTISFPEIIASKNGLSLANQFDMLLVRRYKSKERYSDIDTSIARSMIRNPDSEDEDVVMTEDATGNGESKKESHYHSDEDVGESNTRVPPTKSKKGKKEPQFSDSDDEPQTNSKSKSKPTKLAISDDETSQSDSREEQKVSKKKPVVSDDEFDV